MKHIIISFSILASLVFCTCTKTSPEKSGFYSGKINGKDIILSLRQTGNQLDGYYHYNKKNKDIRLIGNIDSLGNVNLEEFGFFEITANWKGRMDNGKFSGTWVSSDRKIRHHFSVERIAREGVPGDPISDSVAFGAIEINLPSKKSDIPKGFVIILFEGDICISGEMDNPEALFNAEEMDLNNDGKTELLITPLDGLDTIYIYSSLILEKDSTNIFHPILTILGGGNFKILNFKSDGHQDIVFDFLNAGIKKEYLSFKFKGGYYHLSSCITSYESRDNNGNIKLTYYESSPMRRR